MIKGLYQERKWRKPNNMKINKDSHPVTLEDIFEDMYEEKQIYPELLTLMKFALPITLSTVNAEKSFSTLNLLAPKTQDFFLQKLLTDLSEYYYLVPKLLSVSISKFDRKVSRYGTKEKSTGNASLIVLQFFCLLCCCATDFSGFT